MEEINMQAKGYYFTDKLLEKREENYFPGAHGKRLSNFSLCSQCSVHFSTHHSQIGAFIVIKD